MEDVPATAKPKPERQNRHAKRLALDGRSDGPGSTRWTCAVIVAGRGVKNAGGEGRRKYNLLATLTTNQKTKHNEHTTTIRKTILRDI